MLLDAALEDTFYADHRETVRVLASDTVPLPVSNGDDDEDARLLAQALHAYGYSRNSKWVPVIEKLVCIGADIHAGLSANRTSLDNLLEWTQDPYDPEDLAATWLTVLARVGIDVDDYLHWER